MEYQLEGLEEELAGGPGQKVASGEVFATSATLGFQSFPGSEDDADAGAAVAGAVAALTSTAIEAPWAAAVGPMKDAEGTVIVEVLALRHMECSTWTEASG